MVRVDMRDFSALAKKQLQARERRAPEEPQRLALEELEGARATQAGRRPSRQAALARRRRAADLQGDGTDDGSRTGTNSLGHDGVQVRKRKKKTVFEILMDTLLRRKRALLYLFLCTFLLKWYLLGSPPSPAPSPAWPGA